ncbi:hypothetical protein SNE40_022511 [Patella caerulea]|uniref:RRM domain-containing protein n=1 Tax=Patella caerulea TaxID=87958 RepID=A0AAN8GG55_PATCE
MSDNGSPARSDGKKSESDGSPRSKSPSVSRSRSRSPRRSSYRHRYSNSRSRSRSRRYSRSRSRTPPPKHRSRRRHRSRSRSRSPKRYRRNDRDRYERRSKGRSHSPMSNRRRHEGNRDDPEPTATLGVFGLSLYTQERELREVFSRYGTVEQVQIVYDRQSGRSRGFSFIYFKKVDDAIEAKERCNGVEIDGRRIRVDYSITHRAHTPTPGIYLGKPTEPRYRSPSPHNKGHRGRSPSPYRRRSRSRSRSYSPRIEERKMKLLGNET